MRLERAQITWSELRVGILALLSAAVLIAILIYISDSGVFSDTFPIESLLPHARGLAKGDPVLLAGIKIGSVQSIQISSDPTSNPVHVTLSVKQDALQHIHQDAYIEVHGGGLTPTQHIEIQPGSSNAPTIQTGAFLPGQEAPGLEDTLSDLRKVIEQFNTVLNQSSGLLTQLSRGQGSLGRLWQDESLYTELARTAMRVNETLDTVNRGSGGVARILNDPQVGSDLQRTVLAIRTLSERLNQTDGTLGKLAGEDSLYREMEMLLARWSEFTTSLQSNAEHLETLLQSLQPVVEKLAEGDGSLARLLNEPELHDRLTAAADETTRLMRAARQGDGLIPRAIQDPELAEDLSRGLKASSELTAKLNAPGSTLDRLATDTTLYNRLVEISQGFSQLLEQINQTDSTIGTLLRDEELPQELRQFIENLRILVTDIQTHPERYVHFSLF